MIVRVDAQTGEALLVTAHHVIDPISSEITVTAEDEANVKEYEATVMDYDSTKDIALLSICCSLTFRAAEMTTHLPEEGDAVAVIGYGKNKTGTAVTHGKVVGTANRNGVTQIGTDARTVEGDSGSPLVDSDGRVLGIMLGTLDLSALPADFAALYARVGLGPDGTEVAIRSSDVLSGLGLE